MALLTRGFVDHFETEYVRRRMSDGREQRVLAVVGPAVAARGSFMRSELEDVLRWKSGGRNLPQLDTNSDHDIAVTTTAALDPSLPDELRNHMLCWLNGVNTRVASAILTAWSPKRFTVLDDRAMASLRRMSTGGDLRRRELTLLGARPWPLYFVEYVACCDSIARRLKVGLRSLDRALWEWNKEGFPATWRSSTTARGSSGVRPSARPAGS